MLVCFRCGNDLVVGCIKSKSFDSFLFYCKDCMRYQLTGVE